jgi:Zn-dependent M16 (insulinase) family peptidase
MAQSSHFKTVQKLQLEYAPISITQYESMRTGMRVAVVDQKGPKVNGYFSLATEIHDDSGAPHTLEHLCFMGSKAYHYKGLLDKLATRLYSTTNAWTAVETTTYTLDTAGWAAFAQLLPVYLDHLIVPTLTDAGCYTEVHHIDGTGNDAGVVYSEMQATQNLGPELMDLAMRREMYPEGNGFRYETGGMLEQLRVLTADRIRNYHKEMYQPKNMRLVITGEVDHEQLLQIVDKFEDSIIEDVPSADAPFKRPWTESKPTPPIKKSIIKTVKFPEEDESTGEIMIGYLGPHYNDTIAGSAIAVLSQYLCGSSICVLENTLVEREQLCSMVYCQTEERTDSTITFYLSSVEAGRLAEVEERFQKLLHEVAEKPFDMDYLQECLKRLRRQLIAKTENAGDFFSNIVVEDHLYGDRAGSDLKHLENLEDFDVLAKWTEQQWRDFHVRWLADAGHVSILGVPSKELSEKLTSEEKARVKAQQDALGEDGLRKKAEELKRAQAENDRPIPNELLANFTVPSTDSIHFIDTVTARAGAARKQGKLDNQIQTLVDKDDNDSTLFIHFEHIPSNFVRINVIIGTSAVPIELKPLLALYLMNFFTTPIMRGAKRIEFEDVVLDLEKETVSYAMANERGNSDMLCMAFEAEADRYESIIGWISTMLFDAVHDPTRLYASMTKMLADIPDEKREADGMAASCLLMVQQGQGSAVRAQNTLSKALYIRRLRKLLKESEDTVLSKFKELCAALQEPSNFRVFVAANIEKLAHPVSAWKALTDGSDQSRPLRPLDDRKAHLSPVGKTPGNTAFIIPMATTDSSFTIISTKGPDSWAHPDLPALRVAAAYMDAVEGPLWVSVRGTGLAYGTYWRYSPDTGLVTFNIYRSPDSYKAWTVCKEQVEGYASGKISFDSFALEGAISELVLGMANEQPSMGAAAEASFINQVIRGVDKDWNHQQLSKVRAVTPQQIKEAMTKYMVPAFKPETSNMAVTCAQIMEERLVANFSEARFAPEVRTLESFQDDYGLAAGEDGAADDEEEDDDDDEFEDDEDEDDEDEAVDTPGSDEDA